jgi:hypothetical protein
VQQQLHPAFRRLADDLYAIVTVPLVTGKHPAVFCPKCLGWGGVGWGGGLGGLEAERVVSAANPTQALVAACTRWQVTALEGILSLPKAHHTLSLPLPLLLMLLLLHSPDGWPC